MRGLPKVQRGAVPRVSLTLAAGAGTLGIGAAVHLPDVAVALVYVVAVICAALPDILRAKGELDSRSAEVKVAADVAREGMRQRTLLIEAAIEHNPGDAANLLRLQPFHAEALTNPCLNEALLRDLLPDPRVPAESTPGLTAMPAYKPDGHTVGRKGAPQAVPAPVTRPRPAGPHDRH